MKTAAKSILQWQSGQGKKARHDELAVEEPLEIHVDTTPVVVTMRTPGHDEELAAGFLLTEGVIAWRDQIEAIKPHPRNELGNVLDVFLKPKVRLDLKRLTRHVFASSSCGLCGKATIEAIHQRVPPLRSKWRVPASVLWELPDKLRRRQDAFHRTGGLHAAAVFTTRGRLVVVREDVGRHNALDKVVGFGLLKGRLPFDRHVLLVSGRASFEILQKALAARIAVVAAISAPSSLAVEFAERSGQTLVGFLRGRKMNIYSHPERIRDE